ncbi:translation initiation factor IF-2 [Solimonas marina]|uniref:Translation initiation factor IF-2 n=1 Tax=Solimonas marina TaxID=2714601 RepID=A0A970B9S1_9GAMM|nr:translation initiation factor IF-2 [Solimonas marina]NKF22641.1 translation initiation factor IF-2 [Solimonas marina]
MSTVTVQDFAKELNRPVDELLSQFMEAGVAVKSAESPVSGDDKMALLAYLKQKTGGVAVSEPRRITLKRKETSELRLGGGRGAPTKTVSIEVRKKRTFVKPEEPEAPPPAVAAAVPPAAPEPAPVEAPQPDPEALRAAEAKAAAEREQREAAERAAAEAKAEREREEAAAAEAAAEAQAQAQREREAAEAKARAAKEEHERLLKEDPLYREKWEREQARQRAAENIRRAAEAAKQNAAQRAQPGGGAAAAPAGAPRAGRDDRVHRKELHLSEGKGGRREKKQRKPSGRIKIDNVHGFERPVAPIVREVDVPEAITVGELANRMAVKAVELIKVMMKNGVMATINQTLDQDTAVLMVEEMGHKARAVKASDLEDSLEQAVTGDVQEDGERAPRPPVVTIMGHVDHGKTSLLDFIRKTRVAAGEAGGITQHIGAYHVETPKGIVTFLDTPGHAAFTRMRARGAQVTDIAVIVVAADDGVMPQTREAIQHSKAAGAPMIVAITKIDKPDADLDRVKNDLSKEGIIPEDWGGDTQVVGVSAHTGAGIDELLDAILVQAEILELTSLVDAPARGNILEASVEKGRGPVATVLVREGVLRQGDVILSGPHFGRVRAMFDENGAVVKEAGPSIPVQILGLSGAPDAGDDVVVVADERKARELASLREQKLREQKLAQNQAIRMEQVFASMGQGEQKSLNLMVKADVQGSAEAITEALRKIPSEEVKVNVLSTAIGGINESDIDLAMASKAIIIGFNVRADGAARKRIQDTGVDVRYYSIIYEIIDDVSDAVSGLLGTETREQIVGIAQVRDVFRSSAIGNIAGCLVLEGSVQRNLPIRVLRNQTVIYEGVLESLRRFKDDVSKVEAGTECGIGVKDYNDVKAGDQIECFQRVEVRRTVRAAELA